MKTETNEILGYCKCGHSHVSWIGDDDGEGQYEKITPCEQCDCEEYK